MHACKVVAASVLTLNGGVDSLSQEEIVLKLVEYVVRSPEDPTDDLRTLKYPYMACEVICCDIMSITETLATASEGKVAEALFEFLYQPGDVDPRLAGYFEKVGLLSEGLMVASIPRANAFRLWTCRSSRCSWCASRRK